MRGVTSRWNLDGTVIEDLGDGRRVAIDPDRVFYAASLFKLEVMYEVFRQREAGVLDCGEEYVASDDYSGFDLGPHMSLNVPA